MKYKNIRTGAIIEIASVLKGAEWVPVEEEKKPNPTPRKRKTKGEK